MNHSIFGLAATLALVGGSHASVIVDNFESYSPLLGDMNGQGGWTVTNGNPSFGPDGPVVIVDSFTWDASTQSATVGGVEQTAVGLTSLYHSASIPFVSQTPTPTSLKFETAYLESNNGFRNNFQFVLSASSGNLLTIDLTPGAAGQYDVTWSSSFAAGGAIGPLATSVIPTPINSTQFQLDMWADGLNVAYNFSNAGNSISSGTLTGGASQADLITGFAVNWYSNTGGGVGNGIVTIDNVSVVPEPTSGMLGLLGASCAFLRRRRA